MNESDLVVVFDLSSAGLLDLWFPALGLPFVIIGWVMVRYLPRWKGRGNRKFARWRARIFAWVWFCISIVFTLTSLGAILAGNFKLRDAYEAGRFEVVEGSVGSYRAATAGGDDEESYLVGDRRFAYTDFDPFPGFHKTRLRGSPIDEGVYARISHVNGAIVRLEVERSAVERAAGRPITSLWSFFFPPKDEFKPIPEDTPFGIWSRYWARYMWAVIPVIMLGYAATWRWRGRKHIARDPSLKAGYNRMTRGLFLWGSAPVFAGVFVSSFDTVDLSGVLGTSRTFPLSWLAAYIVLGLVIAKWIYWTFYQNGVQKLAEHPGLFDNDRAAKIWPIGFAAIYVLMIGQSLNL